MKLDPRVCLALLVGVLYPAWSQSPALPSGFSIPQSAGNLLDPAKTLQLRLLGDEKVLDPELSKYLERMRIVKPSFEKQTSIDDWLKSITPPAPAPKASGPFSDPQPNPSTQITLAGTPRLPPSILPKGVQASSGPPLVWFRAAGPVQVTELWQGRRPEGFNPVGFPEVVWLANLRTKEECTGTLVSASIVLTAAHCVDSGSTTADLIVITHHRDAKQQSRCAAAMEERRYIRCTVGRFNKTLGIAIHPNYLAGKAEYDLALIRLSKGLSDVKPAVIDFTNKFSRVTLAGFGVTNLTKDASQQDNNDLAQRIEVGWHDGSVVREEVTMTWYVKGTSGTCRGDSGGPIYEGYRDGYATDEVHALVGVIREGTSASCVRYDSKQTRLSNEDVKQWLCGQLDASKLKGCSKKVAVRRAGAVPRSAG
jgi:Trypsin